MKKEKKIFPYSDIDKVYAYIFTESSSVSLPEGCLDLITYVISELFANVKEHSSAKIIRTEFALNKSLFYFSVADDGIGIRNSFLKNGLFAKDDRASVQLAIGGMSAKKKNERAFGLFSTQRLVEHTNGKMRIETGNVKAVFIKNNTTFQNMKKAGKGVRVSVEIPLKKINVYEIIY